MPQAPQYSCDHQQHQHRTQRQVPIDQAFLRCSGADIRHGPADDDLRADENEHEPVHCPGDRAVDLALALLGNGGSMRLVNRRGHGDIVPMRLAARIIGRPQDRLDRDQSRKGAWSCDALG